MNVEPLYKKIGERVRIRRKQLGMSQVRLASELDLSRASLANLETGRQRLLVHQLFRLAEVLDLKVTDLLPDTDDVDVPSDLPLPEGLSAQGKQSIARMLKDDS